MHVASQQGETVYVSYIILMHFFARSLCTTRPAGEASRILSRGCQHEDRRCRRKHESLPRDLAARSWCWDASCCTVRAQSGPRRWAGGSASAAVTLKHKNLHTAMRPAPAPVSNPPAEHGFGRLTSWGAPCEAPSAHRSHRNRRARVSLMGAWAATWTGSWVWWQE